MQTTANRPASSVLATIPPSSPSQTLPVMSVAQMPVNAEMMSRP